MTRLLEQAFDKVSTLPDAQQDELARVMLQLAGVDQPPIQLTPEEEADLAEADAEIAPASWPQPRRNVGKACPVKVRLHAAPSRRSTRLSSALKLDHLRARPTFANASWPLSHCCRNNLAQDVQQAAQMSAASRQIPFLT